MQGYPDAQILVDNPRKAIEGPLSHLKPVKESSSTAAYRTAVFRTRTRLLTMRTRAAGPTAVWHRLHHSFGRQTVEAVNTANMKNYSKNRLHGNGTTAIYPTFINEGNQATIGGDIELARVTLKAKKNVIMILSSLPDLAV